MVVDVYDGMHVNSPVVRAARLPLAPRRSGLNGIS